MSITLKSVWGAVALLLAGIGPAAAVEIPEKYFLFSAYAVEPDDDRFADSGTGFDLAFGRQWTDHIYVEARAFRAIFETEASGTTAQRAAYDSGFGVDLQLLLGQRGQFAGYVLAGVGGAFNDVGNSAVDDAGYQLNAGLGLLSRGLTSTGVRLRLEGRVINEDFLDGVQDVRIGLGLEIPLDPVEIVVREVPVQKVIERQAPPQSDAYPPRPVDSDGDGVLDNFDACKQTLPGTRVDRSGCARKDQVMRLEGVRFEMGSARLLAGSEQALDRAAGFLLGQPQLRVVVAGHTDSLGDADFNEKLSWDRAQAVAEYLVRRGVDPTRLSVVGYGEAQPIASNESEDGRRQNRRVEFEFGG